MLHDIQNVHLYRIEIAQYRDEPLQILQMKRHRRISKKRDDFLQRFHHPSIPSIQVNKITFRFSMSYFTAFPRGHRERVPFRVPVVLCLLPCASRVCSVCPGPGGISVEFMNLRCWGWAGAHKRVGGVKDEPVLTNTGSSLTTPGSFVSTSSSLTPPARFEATAHSEHPRLVCIAPAHILNTPGSL